MGYQENFTEEQVQDLLDEDLSVASSLATLINENGDIRTFLVKKLKELQEQADDAMDEIDDWNALQDKVEASEAQYINKIYFWQ